MLSSLCGSGYKAPMGLVQTLQAILWLKGSMCVLKGTGRTHSLQEGRGQVTRSPVCYPIHPECHDEVVTHSRKTVRTESQSLCLEAV